MQVSQPISWTGRPALQALESHIFSQLECRLIQAERLFAIAVIYCEGSRSEDENASSAQQ